MYGLALGCIVKYIPERTDVSIFENYLSKTITPIGDYRKK